MADSFGESMPHVACMAPGTLTPAVDVNAELVDAKPISPDEAKAVDAYFRRDGDAETIAGIFGLMTSAALLSDLAKEHFDQPKDQEENEEESQ